MGSVKIALVPFTSFELFLCFSQHLRSVSHLTGCLSSSATKGTELRGRRPVQGMNHLSKSDNRFSCINGKTHLSRSRLGQCAESCLFRPSLTTCGGSPVASLRRCALSDPAKDRLSMREPLGLATRRRTRTAAPRVEA